MRHRRFIRAGWIIAINSLAIYLTVHGSSDVRAVKAYLQTGAPSGGPSLGEYLRGAIPALGILLELVGSRTARYVNVGYFAFVAIVLGAAAAYTWSDYQSRTYLLVFCVPAVVVTLMNVWVYRPWTTKESGWPMFGRVDG